MKNLVHGDAEGLEWVRRDLAFRVVWLLLVPIVAVLFRLLPVESIGLGRGPHWHSGLVEGAIIGAAALVAGAAYSAFVIRSSRRPPSLLSCLGWSVYYLVVNAPAEELFFRGFVQSLLVGRLSSVPLAILLAALVFSLQHVFFFGSGFRACVVYFVFGLFVGFVFYRSSNLVEVTLIHAFGDWGMFTFGRYMFSRWRAAQPLPGEEARSTRAPAGQCPGDGGRTAAP